MSLTSLGESSKVLFWFFGLLVFVPASLLHPKYLRDRDFVRCRSRRRVAKSTTTYSTASQPMIDKLNTKNNDAASTFPINVMVAAFGSWLCTVDYG